MTASLVPVPVAGGLVFQSISAGSDHTCGLTAAGEAYCWGDNADYQLGGGMSTDKSDVPRVVPGGLTFQNISAGDKYTCGVAVDGTGYCWGFAGDYRDLGQGDRLGAVVQAPAPIVGGIVFQTISAGSEHTCGISTASVAYCWGSNTYGRLGTTVAIGQKNGFPLPVRSSETFVSIAAGYSHTCAVTTAGVTLCWGDNVKGDVAGAPPQAAFIDSPTIVLGASHFTSVSSGLYYSCGTTAVATYCWGSNSRGQIGDESVTSRSQIVPVHIP